MEYKIILFDKIKSTQDYAIKLCNENKTELNKTIILAKSQSSGHGRYDRQWKSPVGNLYVSFIYKTDKKDPKLSYYIAVAIANSLKELKIESKIKWPNDILIDNKKVCGVLIEYINNFLIIGIGINIKSSPNITKYETTYLNKYLNKETSVEEVLNLLIKNIDEVLKKEFDYIYYKWMEFAIKNKDIIYKNKNYKLIGIDKDGSLILKDEINTIKILSDEIYF